MITFLIVIILVVIVLPIWLLIRMLRLSGRALHWLRTRPKFPFASFAAGMGGT